MECYGGSLSVSRGLLGASLGILGSPLGVLGASLGGTGGTWGMGGSIGKLKLGSGRSGPGHLYSYIYDLSDFILLLLID